MRLTRRNALIGLGTAAAGAGVIGGTGAFTSVEADRSLSVTTEGDADAALGLSEAPDAPERQSDNGGSYVDESGDTISVDVSTLNINAKTVLDPLIRVTNNGASEVSLSVDIDAGWISAESVPGTISAGETGDFGLILDTRDEEFEDDQSFSHTITITAEQS